MRIAFSTSWIARRQRDGMALAEELARLGLNPIELGHGLPVPQLEGILRVVERGDLRVASVHNFCPHPIEVRGGSPDCYEFTSHREADRRRAVKLTKDTIALAARVKADRVVLHGGRARTMQTYRRALDAIDKGAFLNKSYGRLKIAHVREREARSKGLLSRLEEVLRAVLPDAKAAGITLCLENRERPEDVPSERELPDFVRKFGNEKIRAWHDFGHAQIKENLSFLDHRAYLESIAPLLGGCHVHDVRWPNEDHLPPGEGTIPFDCLLPLLPADSLLVFEISPSAPEDRVLAAWNSRRRIVSSSPQPCGTGSLMKYPAGA